MADTVGSAGSPDYDEEFSKLVAGLDSMGEGNSGEAEADFDLDKPEPYAELSAEYRCIALILTPVASCESLTALCALSGLDLAIVPSESGALAYMEINLGSEESQFSALLGAAKEIPAQVESVGCELSKLTRTPVVAVTSWLAPGREDEPDISGQVAARRYKDGQVDADMPAGLVVAYLDQLIEDLLLGRADPKSVKGSESSTQMPRWKALRMLGRGLRRPRR